MKINSKIWLWVISILLIANLILAGVQFFGDKPGKTSKRPFLGEQLNFDKNQTAELKLLIDQHELKLKSIGDSLRINKDQFFKGLRDQKDVEEQTEFVQNIGRLETERDKLTYNHFEAIRNICSESQKSDFDDLLREIMHPKQGPPKGKNGPEDNDGPPPMGDRPPPPTGEDGNRPPPPTGEDGNRPPPPPME